MSRLNRYTKEARQVVSNARAEAQRLRHRMAGTEHILLGLLKLRDPFIEELFSDLSVSTVRLMQALEFVMGRGNKAYVGDPALSTAARNVLISAEREAQAVEAEQVSLEHILLGLFSQRDGITVGVLESFGLYQNPIRQQILTRLHGGAGGVVDATTQFQTKYDATPTLNQVSRDLTAAAMAGMLDPMIGREAELERTMQILSRRSKNNPVLIGHAGVGKTAIAEGLALRIVEGNVPENLLNHRVVALDVGLLTVGTKFRGDFEERLKSITQEIITARGIILVIDELHALAGTGVAEGSVDAANLFKPMLARGEFQCIGATTMDDYRKTIETDPALERRFQVVQIPETTPLETLEVLRGLRARYADFHHVTLSDEALIAAVQMSSRYIQNRYQPDKAIDLIDEAAARVCVQRSVAPNQIRLLHDELTSVLRAKEYAIAHRIFAAASKYRTQELHLHQQLREAERVSADQIQERPVVGEQDVAHVVAMWTGIPVLQIAAEEAERLLKLEDELHHRVIGQHEAVQAVAKAVRRSRTNLRESRRPIGSFIFVGPTGVGKTELARALAASLFGDENALIKLDMSEFMESHSVTRLIGAPPGYIGYDQGGQLTEAVHRHPYSVVLFDEIEKAHPKVFDLLLQILDDGRLTDSRAQSVDFKHTIIIITSNVGTAQIVTQEMAFTPKKRSTQEVQARAFDTIRAQVMLALKDLFRPELLNRVDEIVTFHPLEQIHLREIVDLMVAQTQQRIEQQGIDLQVTDAARAVLVKCGYDPVYGARPLRRTVQRMLEDMLAESILRGTFAAGDTVTVDADENNEERLSVYTPALIQSNNM